MTVRFNQYTVVRQTEAQFQEAVTALAHYCGWRVNHVRRSKAKGDKWATTTSIVGWPDLTLYHPGRGRFLMRELKTEKGRVSPQQKAVLDELAASGVDVDVWRPRDWGVIAEVLTHGQVVHRDGEYVAGVAGETAR